MIVGHSVSLQSGENKSWSQVPSVQRLCFSAEGSDANALQEDFNSLSFFGLCYILGGNNV